MKTKGLIALCLVCTVAFGAAGFYLSKAEKAIEKNINDTKAYLEDFNKSVSIIDSKMHYVRGNIEYLK